MILRLTITAGMLIEEIGTCLIEHQVIDKIIILPQDGLDELQGIKPVVLNTVCQVTSINVKHRSIH